MSFLSQLEVPELGFSEVLVFSEDSEADNFWVGNLLGGESSAVDHILVNLHSEAWIDLLWHL